MFPSRILKAQTLYERPVHFLCGEGNEVRQLRGWLLDAHPRELVEEIEDFLVLPPGARHAGKTIGNTVPNQIFVSQCQR